MEDTDKESWLEIMTSNPAHSKAAEEDRNLARDVLITLAREKDSSELASILGISLPRAKVIKSRYQNSRIAALPYAQTVELMRRAGLI